MGSFRFDNSVSGSDHEGWDNVAGVSGNLCPQAKYLLESKVDRTCNIYIACKLSSMFCQYQNPRCIRKNI